MSQICKHISGNPKISKKHTTVLSDIFKIVVRLSKEDYVKKISLGHIRRYKSVRNERGVKTKIDVMNEFSVKIHFIKNGFQEIRVFFENDNGLLFLKEFLLSNKNIILVEDNENWQKNIKKILVANIQLVFLFYLFLI